MSDFSTDPVANGDNNDPLTFQVGERQYDAESAATKIEAADNHINTLESEHQGYKDTIAALEAKVATSTKIDEALAKLQTATPQESQPPATEQLSEEQIGEIANKQFTDLMTQNEVKTAEVAAKALAESTFNASKEVLITQFGDKTEQVMKDKAVEMGVSLDQLIGMVSDPVTSKLILATLKVSTPASQANPSSSFNSSSQAAQASEAKEGWYKGSSSTIMDELQRRRQNLS